jgi:hypothetical protein
MCIKDLNWEQKKEKFAIVTAAHMASRISTKAEHMWSWNYGMEHVEYAGVNRPDFVVLDLKTCK